MWLLALTDYFRKVSGAEFDNTWHVHYIEFFRGRGTESSSFHYIQLLNIVDSMRSVIFSQFKLANFMLGSVLFIYFMLQEGIFICSNICVSTNKNFVTIWFLNPSFSILKSESPALNLEGCRNSTVAISNSDIKDICYLCS